MHALSIRALGLAAALLATLGGCGFDLQTPAPISEPARSPGPCGTTENLFQGLFELTREGGLEALQAIIAEHSAPGPTGQAPDLSIRNVLGAAIRIVTTMGIRAAREAAFSLGKGPVAEVLSSIIVQTLKLLSGDADGRSRHDASAAMAFYLRRCDAEHVLTVVERSLKLRHQSAEGKDERWLSALFTELAGLLADPTFDQFLVEFEGKGERGQAAVVGLLNQIVGFLADEGFEVARVRALLEGSVYPLVDPSLAARLDRLISLFEDGAEEDPTLQASVRWVAQCALVDETARRDLLGFGYDVVSNDQFPLFDLLEDASLLLVDEGQTGFLDHLAGLAAVIREEREARQDIFVFLAVLLEPPDVDRALPLLIELFERDLVAELMFGVTTLLAGCEATER